MTSVVVVSIFASGNAWKVGEPSDRPARVRKRPVKLEIQGDAQNGYHLVMSPEGCFTADTWHMSIADAKATAEELFNAPPDGWA